MEHITNLSAGSKAMLRVLKRDGPMKPSEFNTHAMFDVSMNDEGRTLETLMERGLAEKYRNRFDVELLRLTPDAEDFIESMDSYVFEDPDMSELFE